MIRRLLHAHRDPADILIAEPAKRRRRLAPPSPPNGRDPRTSGDPRRPGRWPPCLTGRCTRPRPRSLPPSDVAAERRSLDRPRPSPCFRFAFTSSTSGSRSRGLGPRCSLRMTRSRSRKATSSRAMPMLWSARPTALASWMAASTRQSARLGRPDPNDGAGGHPRPAPRGTPDRLRGDRGHQPRQMAVPCRRSDHARPRERGEHAERLSCVSRDPACGHAPRPKRRRRRSRRSWCRASGQASAQWTPGAAPRRCAWHSTRCRSPHAFPVTGRSMNSTRSFVRRCDGTEELSN